MLINQKILPEDIDSLKQTIAKGMATPGLLAYIAAAKYADALPLYRQEKIFGRYGIDLSRLTMAGWMFKTGQACEPKVYQSNRCQGQSRSGQNRKRGSAAFLYWPPLRGGKICCGKCDPYFRSWLFAGHPNGAEALATLYSLIESAKACGPEPYRYLGFLFERIPYAATKADYQALLPQTVDPVQLA